MHVLMLGWEFPPFITGGLGTACHGLTRGLDRRGVRVTFVLPKHVEGTEADHVSLLSPSSAEPSTPESMEPLWASEPATPGSRSAAGGPGEPASLPPGPRTGGQVRRSPPYRDVRFVEVPSELVNPYQRAADEGPVGAAAPDAVPAAPPRTASGGPTPSPGEPGEPATGPSHAPPPPESALAPGPDAPPPAPTVDYGGDLFQHVARYAHFCVEATRGLEFDVIHAHDWMTYPAGLWIARRSGKPLVVHVHSTEFDRAGEHVNQVIYDLERRGMHGAMRVITVSQLTKSVVMQRYGLPESRVEVVYNGVEIEPGKIGITGIRSRDKIVLYFGRITYQKGPEYFVNAAKRVLEVMDNVKFVVAGSGDMAQRMIEMAAEAGIGHKVLFTGFLRGADIQRVFALADLYVMPSISEPFGIAPLEAMGHDVPVLISRTSGVSEVLSHALKVDFWDIDDMANKIIAVLRHPPLSQTLRHHGAFEARSLTWDGAANRCEQVYHRVVAGMSAPMHA